MEGQMDRRKDGQTVFLPILQGLPEWSEGLLEGPGGLPEGPVGLLEGSEGLPERPEGLPEGSEGLPGESQHPTDSLRAKDRHLDVQEDRIIPCSTGNCPLSGPLPKK